MSEHQQDLLATFSRSRSYQLSITETLTPSASQHSEATQHYGAAMRGQVADPGGGHAADQHGKAAQNDHVRRPNADGHVAHTRGWQTADQHGDRRRRQDRPA